MIRVDLHKGRAELRTGTLTGSDWLSYDALMSESGSAFDVARQARSVALDVLPDVLTRLGSRYGDISYSPGLSLALRRRADRFTPRVSGLDPRLAKYQCEGVSYLRARFSALLADDMGLGKTAQLLQAIGDTRAARVLVICPAIAKAVWRYEAGLWAPGLRMRVLSGRGSFAWPLPGEAVVLNYDILPREGDPLPEAPPGVTIILDEVHFCKGKTIRSRSAKRLVRAARLAGGRAWGATGTPLDNRPPDLYGVTDVLGLASEWGGWPNFVRLMGGFRLPWGGLGWGKPRPEAKTALSRIMLRRRKSDVLDLPPVAHCTRPVELTRADATAIDAAMSKSGVRVQDITEAALTALAANPHIMTARRLLAAAKAEALVEWVEECESAEEPAVIFSAHRLPIDMFLQRLGWRVITGDTNPESRAQIVRDFQAGRLKGVAGTIRAMGIAATMTRGCLAAFVDYEWNPGANQQARDRLHRIGQSRSITIYSFVADHPIDRRVAEILAEKTVRQQLSIDAITTTPDSVRAAAMRRLSIDIDLSLM